MTVPTAGVATSATGAARAQLRIDGLPLDPVTSACLHTLEVDLRDDGPGSFTITFADSGLTTGPVPTGIPVTEGMSVAVSLGWGDALRPVLSGIVTAVSLSCDPEGGGRWRVEGFDRLHELSYGTVTQAYVGPGGIAEPDERIVSTVALRHRMNVVAPGPSITVPPPEQPRVQHGETDLRFLQRLAALSGCGLWVDETGTLHFRPTRTTTSVPKRVTSGRNLVSFDGRISLGGQVGRVTAHGWDPAHKQPLTATRPVSPTWPLGAAARAHVGSSTLDVRSPTVTSVAKAQELARSVADDVAADLVTASMVVEGDPSLRPVGRVLLEGLGRFDGPYQVTSARHVVSDGGYLTHLGLVGGTAAPSPGSRTAARARSQATLLPVAVTEVQDPENRGRIKVRRPEAAGAEDFWVRLLVPVAGNDRGTFWLPAVGDEVLLLAEGPDLAAGYVVGSLWSAKDRPPEPASAAATRHTLKTPSGALLRFDDSPGAERIELVASDGSTTVVLDGATGAITLHAAADLTLEAPKGKLTLSGATVEVTSTTRTAVSSRATSELTGGDAVTIRGARVDIN